MAPGTLRVAPLWQVILLHLFGWILILGGSAWCLQQVFVDGLWPLPVGLIPLAAGGWLWSLGTRARLRRAGRLVKA
jgi:hypothetical protein